MGHSILVCDFCKSYVMEGHNDWDCDCGAHCSSVTNFQWKKQENITEKEKKIVSRKIQNNSWPIF